MNGLVWTVEADDDLESLARTLRSDDALRGVRVEQRVRPPREGEMGPVPDALLIAFGSGGLGIAALQAVSAWLADRRRPLRVKVTRADGASVELESTYPTRPEELAALAKSLLDNDLPA